MTDFGGGYDLRAVHKIDNGFLGKLFETELVSILKKENSWWIKIFTIYKT